MVTASNVKEIPSALFWKYTEKYGQNGAEAPWKDNWHEWNYAPISHYWGAYIVALHSWTHPAGEGHEFFVLDANSVDEAKKRIDQRNTRCQIVASVSNDGAETLSLYEGVFPAKRLTDRAYPLVQEVRDDARYMLETLGVVETDSAKAA
jgi:hypothetical protein